MSLRRVDARFLLPSRPTSATVLGDMPEWRSGLAAAHVAVAEAGDGPPDLVVAPGRLAVEAIRLDAPMTLLEGSVARGALRGTGRSVSRYLALPNVESPELVLPLGSRAPLQYALGRWRIPPRRLTWWRNRVVGHLCAAGLPAYPSDHLLTVASTAPGRPYPLTSVRASAGVSDGASDGGFMVVLGPPHAAGRIAVVLFPARSSVPGAVMKFARLPGGQDNDSDEDALAEVARAGRVTSDHAPRLFGRTRLDQLDCIVESAAVGARLTDVLRGPFRTSVKLGHVGRVAAWLVDVAASTASAPADLDGERGRAEREIRGFWHTLGVPVDLMDGLPPVPSVLRHGDLWSDNVVVDGAGFTVLDWAEASRAGFPMSDIVYFLADALARVDGVSGSVAEDQHFLQLFRGELATSPFVFSCIRRMVDALGIPSHAVGTLAALGFMGIARGGRVADEPQEVTSTYTAGARHPSERLTSLWFSSPDLGAGWKQWEG